MGMARGLLCSVMFSSAPVWALHSQRVERPLGDRERPGRAERAFLITSWPTVLGLVPTYSTADSQTVLGVAIRFENVTRFPALPFNIAVADKQVMLGSQTHNRVQIDAEIDPFSEVRVLGVPVSGSMTAQYRQTAAVSTLQEYTAELDGTIHLSRSQSLYPGILCYYDRMSPSAGGSTSGFTPALDLLWKFSPRTKAFAEYDFKTSFSGDFDFVVKLTHYLISKPTYRLGAFAQYERHDIFAFGGRAEIPGPRF